MLKIKLKKKGVTQRWVAKKLKIPESILSTLLNNEHLIKKIKDLLK